MCLVWATFGGAGQTGARETVDVLLGQPMVATFPGAPVVGAGEDRAVVDSGKDRAALRLDQQGVDVLVGQRPMSDVPPRAARIALHAHHPLDRADQDLPGARSRTIDRGPAVREGDGHGCLLFVGAGSGPSWRGTLRRITGHVNTYQARSSGPPRLPVDFVASCARF